MNESQKRVIAALLVPPILAFTFIVVLSVTGHMMDFAVFLGIDTSPRSFPISISMFLNGKTRGVVIFFFTLFMASVAFIRLLGISSTFRGGNP